MGLGGPFILSVGIQGWLVKGLCGPGNCVPFSYSMGGGSPLFGGEWQGHCRRFSLAAVWVGESGGREASELSDTTVQVKE